MQNRRKNARNIRVKRGILALAAVLLLVPVLSACSFSQSTGEEEARVLRIATMFSYGSGYLDHLRTQYTDVFDFTHPNIEVEFVAAVDQNYRYMSPSDEEEEPDPVEEMKKLMQGPNPPDLVMMEYQHLPAFVEENLLTPLEPLMEESEFSLEDFVPVVVDGLRSASGNNQLYALAPTFNSEALIYNRALFDQAGVEYPHDGMTWQEVFDLARRVSGGEGTDRVYGFGFEPYYYSDPFRDMQIYTAPLQLKIFDDNAETMTVNTEAWAQVWKTILNLHEEKIFPQRPENGKLPEGPFQHDAFLSGKLAMTIMRYNRLDEIINANRNADQIENFDPIDWDVVTVPVHPEYPDVGGQVNMEPIMAINAKAQNPEDAWTFMEFINGEDWAELKSKSSSNMVARKSYIEPKQGVEFNVAAFYQLKPAPNPYQELYREKPNLHEVEFIGRRKFHQVVQGELTVEEALAQWENEGNAMLQEIKENPDGPIDMDMIMKEQAREAAGE